MPNGAAQRDALAVLHEEDNWIGLGMDPGSRKLRAVTMKRRIDKNDCTTMR